MSTISAILAIVVILFWLGVIAILIFRGLDMLSGYRRPKWLALYVVVLVLWIAVPFGYVMAHLDDDDEHPDRVCLHGHQEWVVTNTGKTTSRVKTWVCETWETR